MNIQTAFLEALRATREPAHLRDIYAKHRELGGTYTQRGLGTAAWQMTRDGVLTRVDSPQGPLYERAAPRSARPVTRNRA